MPVFEYEIADRKGSRTRGKVEAADTTEAIARLRERGHMVLALRESKAAAPRTEGRRATLRLSTLSTIRGVKLSVLVLFTSQLSAMLTAGLHLTRILGALGAETPDKRFQRVVGDVRESIMAGGTFADALARHPSVFNTLYVAVVRAGELSGSLPLVLDMLTVYLEKAAQLRRKIVSAVSYPIVILAVALVIVFVIILSVVPIFEGVYARSGAKLPLPTQVLMGISRAIRNYTLLSLLALAGLGAAGYYGLQQPRGRYLWDAAKLYMPVFGALIRKAIMARVCRTLSVLLQSGIPLIEALETVSRVANNKVVEGALRHAAQSVRDGVTIADSLRVRGVFPGMVLQFVSTGEESGTLPAMLTKAAVYYEQQVDATVATLSSLVEPIMIVVMGSIVGGVIFALYLPIFGIGQAMRGLK